MTREEGVWIKTWDWEASWKQACTVGFVAGRRFESGGMDDLCPDSLLLYPYIHNAKR